MCHIQRFLSTPAPSWFYCFCSRRPISSMSDWAFCLCKVNILILVLPFCCLESWALSRTGVIHVSYCTYMPSGIWCLFNTWVWTWSVVSLTLENWGKERGDVGEAEWKDQQVILPPDMNRTSTLQFTALKSMDEVWWVHANFSSPLCREQCGKAFRSI